MTDPALVREYRMLLLQSGINRQEMDEVDASIASGKTKLSRNPDGSMRIAITLTEAEKTWLRANESGFPG